MIRSHVIPMSKGFTLVESLIALVILGLVAVAFVPLITQGFSEVFISGYRIQAIHQAQIAVDTKVATGQADNEDATLTIIFPGIGTYAIDGEEFQTEVEFQDRTTSITVFLPK